MAARMMKYNPAFLSDEEMIDTFAVRQAELKSILDILRENNTRSNQHVLIVGPRGIGKTTLVRRVRAEVRRDEALGRNWYPLAFGEESYHVGSMGEFWQEAIFHIAEQTGDNRWRQIYEELQEEKDEPRLRERALGYVLDLADKMGKRILLMVENLNMLFDEQLGDKEAWQLRKVLQNEPRIMLLGTATKRFENIDGVEKAFFELFKTIELPPLDVKECHQIWNTFSEREMSENQIKAIRILTGGNPRLLGIMIRFAEKRSFKELLEDLTGTIDEHTEYFKSHLDGLAPMERKVFVAMMEAWDPVTARQVARAARMEVSKCSSFLNRLMTRGAVMEVPAKGRTKSYQVAERLYNIYYLMRRRGHVSSRVEATVRVIMTFYGSEQTAHLIGNELQAEMSEELLWATKSLLDHCPKKEVEKILKMLPPALFEKKDLPEGLAKYLRQEDEPETEEWLRQANDIINLTIDYGQTGKLDEARKQYDQLCQLTRRHPQMNRAHLAQAMIAFNLITAYGNAGQISEARGLYEQLAQLAGVYPQEAQMRLAQAQGVVNLITAYGNAGQISEARGLYEPLVQLAGAYPQEAEVRLAQAQGAFNLIYAYLNAGQISEARGLYEPLVQLAGAYPQEAEMRLRQAQGAVNLIYAYGNAGQISEARGLYEPLAQLAEAYPQEAGVRLAQAQGAVNLITDYGNAGQISEALGLYEQLVQLAGAYPQEAEMRLRQAQGEVNLIYAYGNAGQISEARGLYEQLVQLAGAYPREAGVRLEQAKGAFNLITYYGNAGQISEALGLYEQLAQLAKDHPQEAEVRLLQAQGAFILSIFHNKEGLKSTERLRWERDFVDCEGFVKPFADRVIGYFIAAAAEGRARESLEVLRGSAGERHLEPLVVALERYLGEDTPIRAQEIEEVAKDIVEKIKGQENA